MKVKFEPAHSYFLGGRLKELREARGLTISQLASLTGISKQSLSSYEKGSQKPRSDSLSKLVSSLGVSLAYFQKEIPEHSCSPIFFRSLASMQKKERLRASVQMGWFEELYTYLSQYINFVAPNVPKHLDISDRLVRTTFEDIDAISEDVRTFWGLGSGPISHVVRLFENNGIVILTMNLDVRQEDAFSQWQGDLPVIVSVADTLAAVRQRFTLAHELGHLILHSKLEQIDSEKLPLIEKQAHRFASSFLLPEKAWAREFHSPDLDSFRNLKERWKVSIAAQIHRARDLGIISEDYMRNLYIGLAKRKWKTKEPLDDSLPHEKPAMLKDAISLLNVQINIDISEIASAISLAESDIELLCGIESEQVLESSCEELTPTPHVVRFSRSK